MPPIGTTLTTADLARAEFIYAMEQRAIDRHAWTMAANAVIDAIMERREAGLPLDEQQVAELKALMLAGRGEGYEL